MYVWSAASKPGPVLTERNTRPREVTGSRMTISNFSLPLDRARRYRTIQDLGSRGMQHAAYLPLNSLTAPWLLRAPPEAYHQQSKPITLIHQVDFLFPEED